MFMIGVDRDRVVQEDQTTPCPIQEHVKISFPLQMEAAEYVLSFENAETVRKVNGL
jgi:hypothetical protein